MTAARLKFWLRWSAATVIGGLLALAVQWLVAAPAQAWISATIPASGLRDQALLAERALAFLAGSVILAGTQAIVIRRFLGRVLPWLTAAAVGALLEWFLTRWLASSSPAGQSPDGLVLACVGALLFSACLWAACLGRADRAGLFIVASVAAAALLNLYVGPRFPLLAGTDGRPALIEGTIAAALVTGGLTGLALALTIVRPRPAARPRRPPAGRRTPARRRPARAPGR